MSNEATQLELALLAPHMADMVAPLVQDPLRLDFNPVGILHGNPEATPWYIEMILMLNHGCIHTSINDLYN